MTNYPSKCLICRCFTHLAFACQQYQRENPQKPVETVNRVKSHTPTSIVPKPNTLLTPISKTEPTQPTIVKPLRQQSIPSDKTLPALAQPYKQPTTSLATTFDPQTQPKAEIPFLSLNGEPQPIIRIASQPQPTKKPQTSTGSKQKMQITDTQSTQNIPTEPMPVENTKRIGSPSSLSNCHAQKHHKTLSSGPPRKIARKTTKSLSLYRAQRTKRPKIQLTKDLLAGLPMTDTLFTFKNLLRFQHNETTTIPNPYPPSMTDLSEFTSMEDEDKYSQHSPNSSEALKSIGHILPINLFE
jgi:hypothetical protein